MKGKRSSIAARPSPKQPTGPTPAPDQAPTAKSKPGLRLVDRTGLLPSNVPVLDIVLVVTPAGEIVDANEAAAKAYGIDRALLLHRNVSELRAPGHGGSVARQLRVALDRGIRFETVHRRADGSEFPVEVVSSRVVLRKRTLLLSVIRDLSDRKQAQMALARSEAMLRVCLEAAQMGTWDWDLQSGDLFWGERCKALFDLPPATRTTYDVFLAAIHPEDRARIDHAVQDALHAAAEYDVEMRVPVSDGSQRWIRSKGKVMRDSAGAPIRMSGCALDITDRVHAEQRLRQAHQELEQKVEVRTAELATANQRLRVLTGRLLQLQDDERRRLSRELHDSAGQMLAALSINFAALSQHATAPAAEHLIADCHALLSQMSSEIRTMSYLLHPPLLDEVGLESALGWYIDGFSARSGIQTSLTMRKDFGRLSKDQEITLFRIVQEALTNVLRHSASASAQVELRRVSDQVELEITDQGKGISPEQLSVIWSSGTAGVGLAGMRERLSQFGGTLSIDSSETGTKVFARLPLAQS